MSHRTVEGIGIPYFASLWVERFDGPGRLGVIEPTPIVSSVNYLLNYLIQILNLV
jgi:hypothetical protein